MRAPYCSQRGGAKAEFEEGADLALGLGQHGAIAEDDASLLQALEPLAHRGAGQRHRLGQLADAEPTILRKQGHYLVVVFVHVASLLLLSCAPRLWPTKWR